jgi:hypothetical protein
MCTRPTHSRVKSLRAEQVVCEAASWPGIRTGLYTHVYACTHLHARGGWFNPGAWCGWWFDGGAAPAAQCHRHTVLDRHPSQPCDTLHTLTARQWAKHRPTASRAVCSFTTTPTLHWTPPSAATTRTRRSWCRCDAQHTHGTRLWLAAVGASWRDRSCPLRVGGSVGVAVLTSGRA